MATVPDTVPSASVAMSPVEFDLLHDRARD